MRPAVGAQPPLSTFAPIVVAGRAVRIRWSLLAAVLMIGACDAGGSESQDPSPSTVVDTTEAAPPTTLAPDREWCTSVTQTIGDLDLALGDPVESFTPERMGELAARLDDGVDSSPTETRSDAIVLRDRFGALRALVERYEYAVLSIPEAELTAALSEAALDAAIVGIDRYCGITPDDVSAPSTIAVEPDPAEADPEASPSEDSAPSEAVDTDDTDDTDDADGTDGAIEEYIRSLAPALGVTEDQARCLVDELDLAAIVVAGGDPAPAVADGIFEVLAACGISPADLVG